MVENQYPKMRDIGLKKGSAFRPRSEQRVQNKTTNILNKSKSKALHAGLGPAAGVRRDKENISNAVNSHKAM